MVVVMVPRCLAENLRNRLENIGSVLSDDIILLIHDIFGAASFPAVTYFERGSLTVEQSPSGRCLYKLEPHHGAPQYCSYHAHYCPCISIFVGTKVLNLDARCQLWCEHLLAILLMRSLNRHRSIQVDDDKLAHSVELMYTESSIPTSDST
ncbi:hypothetical protein CRM22_010125 [Opisthorchis felineus]|uniref:SWIM-type domain-containing protein n=1 Tax=Opisthorchis felineus TaxID=147828 RepID=A0A4S2L244_OPIFE|nr:hypothetical protein CRM22_010125 [Opisthorchis felineus]